MSRKHWPLIVLGVLVQLGACTKDEGPIVIKPLPGTEPFDTVHFTTQVLPIIQLKCWLCHPPNGGLDLSEELAYENLVNVESTLYPPNMRVVPYDPEASVLWHKVINSGVYGIEMPPVGESLTMEELQAVRDWIEQGAMNN